MGSKFDIKVELNSVVEQKDVLIELNGSPIAKTIANKPEYIANENGKGSSIVFRDVQLKQAGKYQLIAKSPSERLEVIWDVYASGPRKVKMSSYLLVME